MATTRVITAEDLWRMQDDGCRYDLIRGELIRMAPAGGEHGETAGEFGRQIGNFVHHQRLGRVYAAATGFLLARDPDVVMGPDVAFVRADRLPPRALRRGYIPVAPDLVVEVTSPRDRRRAVMAKVQAYLEHGVRLVWLVDPRRRTITAYRPAGVVRVFHEQDELDGEDVLPGSHLRVASIFDGD